MLRVNKAPFKMSRYTRDDSTDDTMVKAHAYLAVNAGSVHAYVTMTTGGNTLNGYVGLTNDPAGAGDLIRYHGMGNTVYPISISFDVAKGEYFEVTTSNSDAVIWWKSYGPLKNPIDFN